MDLPIRGPRDHAAQLPPLRTANLGPAARFGPDSELSSTYSSVAPLPMMIPGAPNTRYIPPPLPPPRYAPNCDPTLPGIREEPGRAWLPSTRRDSMFGSFGGSPGDEPAYKRRDGARMPRDEGYASFSSTSKSSGPQARLSSGMIYQDHKTKLNAYDTSLLKKLDSARTPQNRSPPRRISLPSAEDGQPAPPDRFTLPRQPLSVRTRRDSPQDSLCSEGLQSHSAVSPNSTPYVLDDRSRPASLTGNGTDQSPDRRFYRSGSGASADDVPSTRGNRWSRDVVMSDDADNADETRSFHRLHLDDASARPDYQPIGTSLKRRASSPLSDEFCSIQGDQPRRRDGRVSRTSPVPLRPVTHVPVAACLSIPSVTRSSSYTSALPVLSILNALGSGVRRGGASPPAGASPTDTASGSPYSTPISSTTSPRMGLASTRVGPLQRSLSGRMTSPRKMPDFPSRASVAAKISEIQGFRCSCCPKKPKVFPSAKELAAHELEKQFGCQFCPNRFKNKNEAERHQNSLHVRRSSWSCSALFSEHSDYPLKGYDRAFYESSSRPGEADMCGYCGDEFPRRGVLSGNVITTRSPSTGVPAGGLVANDQDWELRIRHLQDAHKVMECNATKKFYRADHFRQHLKHSHGGTSGKWTNMLENACMKPEPPEGDVDAPMAGPLIFVDGRWMRSAPLVPGPIDVHAGGPPRGPPYQPSEMDIPAMAARRPLEWAHVVDGRERVT